MSESATQPLPPRVLEVMDAHFSEYAATFGRLPHGEIYDPGDVLCVVSRLADPHFNAACRAGFPSESADARIEDICGFFAARHAPFAWLTGPLSRPADLGSRLTRHGLVLVGTLTGMAMDLASLAATIPSVPGLTIDRVTEAPSLHEWTRTVAAINPGGDVDPDSMLAFHQPSALGAGADLHCYLGRVEGRPAGTALLFLGTAAASLWWIGTLPQVRGQGIGTAMTVAALHAAHERGYRQVVLQALAPGKPIYERLGFRSYGEYRIYVWRPAPLR